MCFYVLDFLHSLLNYESRMSTFENCWLETGTRNGARGPQIPGRTSPTSRAQQWERGHQKIWKLHHLSMRRKKAEITKHLLTTRESTAPEKKWLRTRKPCFHLKLATNSTSSIWVWRLMTPSGASCFQTRRLPKLRKTSPSTPKCPTCCSRCGEASGSYPVPAMGWRSWPCTATTASGTGPSSRRWK